LTQLAHAVRRWPPGIGNPPPRATGSPSARTTSSSLPDAAVKVSSQSDLPTFVAV
jgi:hypothetical protein